MIGDGELFWNASIEELENGYVLMDEKYVCLLCGERFLDGVIYPSNGVLCEARKAISLHIQEDHVSVFDYLLKMDKKYTGLSEHQRELLLYFKKG